MATNTANKPEQDRYPDETVLTVADTARFLRVSESIVRRLIREQRIPFFRIRGRYLMYRPVIEEWIRQNTVSPTQTPPDEATDIATQLWTKRRLEMTHG